MLKVWTTVNVLRWVAWTPRQPQPVGVPVPWWASHPKLLHKTDCWAGSPILCQHAGGPGLVDSMDSWAVKCVVALGFKHPSFEMNIKVFCNNAHYPPTFKGKAHSIGQTSTATSAAAIVARLKREGLSDVPMPRKQCHDDTLQAPQRDAGKDN